MRTPKRFLVLLAVALTAALVAPTAKASDNWTQQGSGILGSIADERTGWSTSLSADGLTLAIGAPFNGNSRSDTGRVHIYTWNGSTWTPKGSTINGLQANEDFGFSVALSADGNTVAIGARFANVTGAAAAGQVRVYTWDGTAWNLKGAAINGAAETDYSGSSVAITSDGNTVAIGSVLHEMSEIGHVRVFIWNGSAWVQQGGDIDGEDAGDRSGQSVSLSSDGTVLAIGAEFNDGNGSDSGHVRVYTWDGNSWDQRGNDIDGEAAGDKSGSIVSLSADGTTLAIGAVQNDGNGSDSGHVRVYTWDGNSWVQRGNDIDGQAAIDYFGRSVALSADGNTLAAGATLNDGGANDGGHVRVFTWDGTAWTQRGSSFEGEVDRDFLGRSVALSADGFTLAIGIELSDDGAADAGKVLVFTWPRPTTGDSVPGPETYFSYFLPDGRECTSISPQRVQVGTYVELPGESALCQTSDGSLVAGWTIPVAPGFTGAGSSSLPLNPGHRVRVIESQRFTAVTLEPVLTIEYDSNIADDDACTPANLVNASDSGRAGYSWVPRVDFTLARAWDQAPCTPEGYELIGWNTTGDGSGQRIDLGVPLPEAWETSTVNEYRLYAVWRAVA